MALLKEVLAWIFAEQIVVVEECRWINWEVGYQKSILLGPSLQITRSRIEAGYPELLNRELHEGIKTDRVHEGRIVITLNAEKHNEPVLFGSLAVFDRDWDGLSVRHKNGTSYTVSGDDMLDYEMEENLPEDFLYHILTKKEQEWFFKKYNQIRSRAKHREYYDAFDNTWKNH